MAIEKQGRGYFGVLIGGIEFEIQGWGFARVGKNLCSFEAFKAISCDPVKDMLSCFLLKTIGGPFRVKEWRQVGDSYVVH